MNLTSRSKSIGMNESRMRMNIILVLFILLVLAAQTFCIPSRDAKAQDDERVSIALSTRFILKNSTSLYTLVATAFKGDYESTGGPGLPSSIPPGSEQNFEVKRSVYKAYNYLASAYYNVVHPTSGNVGTVIMDMIVYGGTENNQTRTDTAVETTGPVYGQLGSSNNNGYFNVATIRIS
ncbi:hypothetical protein M3223_14735 [Paenibacillus pasadenensis]|uniref:hypothetical protein n=1 Tax=Paenibacillus pasadenensis TaxID=217090 RepID=UPI00203E368F|nr:hypothetical protein [Paenibacillus pasadenensis]MCM3748605.1 hypothetical protein [Paenibacillus pasadenensis]